MRIVVLGDFHMHKDEYGITRMVMEDVQRCAPDLVIPLGDFGSSGRIGTPEGLKEAKAMLELTEAPWRPIMGNHDLENEAGPGKQEKGTMERAFRETFEIDEPFGVWEYDEFRLFFASTDPQPEESCYQVQECYVSDTQFQALVQALEERPGVPVLFFTHAPPLGCGLKTVPRTHVRATNAYLDQNHDPERWLALYKNYPEIIAWFSAHYHLSHHHSRAHTERHGTHFFHTGVHGMCTRDGLRQSRVIDIHQGRVTVRTLDHKKRCLTEQGGWHPSVPLSGLMHQKAFCCLSSTAVDGGSLLRNKLRARGNGRYIVETDEGYCWEVKPEWEAVLGALSFGEALYDMAVTAEGVWLVTSHGVTYSKWNDLNRFVRTANDGLPKGSLTGSSSPDCIAPCPDGSVWACMNDKLYRLAIETGQGGERLACTMLTALKEEAVKVMAEGAQCRILGVSGSLYEWDGNALTETYPYNDVLDWDACGGSHAGAYVSGHQLWFVYVDASTGKHHEMVIDCGEKGAWQSDDVQVLCFDGHHALVRVDGALYWWAGEDQPMQRLYMQTDTVAAIAHADLATPSSQERIRFALTTEGVTAETPTIQVWEYERRRGAKNHKKDGGWLT